MHTFVRVSFWDDYGFAHRCIYCTEIFNMSFYMHYAINIYVVCCFLAFLDVFVHARQRAGAGNLQEARRPRPQPTTQTTTQRWCGSL